MGANDKLEATFHPQPPTLERQWWTYVGPWSFWTEDPGVRFGLSYEGERMYLTTNIRDEDIPFSADSPFAWRETYRVRIFRLYQALKTASGDGWFAPEVIVPTAIVVETGGFLPGEWFKAEEPEAFKNEYQYTYVVERSD